MRAADPPGPSQRTIERTALLACLLEVSAAKPGNVSPGRDFADTRFEDFLFSAAATAPVLGSAGERGLGATVLRAIEETRRWVRTNTNLGIVLLLAPLARACARGGPLRPALGAVLRETTREDAAAVFAAIRLANPGGLGRVEAQDVRDPPTVSLRAAMRLAAERDTIAREYTTDFAVTFEVAVPALRAARTRGAAWVAAAVECFLRVLSTVPDSLIARKHGGALAAAASERAARVLAAGETDAPERRFALEEFDAWLRDPRRPLNPGTSADLTAAALFVALWLEPSPAAPD